MPKIFNYKTKLGYSRVEIVNDHQDIKHDGIRGVLKFLNIKYGMEICHLSDLPAKTGIGSSSAFIVGLLNALHSVQNKVSTKQDLAEEAIYVERKLLNESGGIQDQIWSAYGGFNCIDIKQDGSFDVKPLPVSNIFIDRFLKRSIVIYTGNVRNSFKIAESYTKDKAEDYQKKIATIAHEAYIQFEKQNITRIGELLDESWHCKRNISDLISNNKLDNLYKALKNDGVVGAKLLGAGGSGFMFGILQEGIDQKSFKNKYRNRYIDVDIDREGSSIINE
jgi:D-glycero-alpha-D-manno-heptose-7-phosphate kinase